MGTLAASIEHWRAPLPSMADALSEPTPSPAEVRRIIMEQHERIRALLRRIERRATRLLATPVPAAADREATRRSALALCSVMVWHIVEENRILLPLLEHADAWGPVRAAQVRADHDEQLLLLRAYATALEQPWGSGATLGLITWQLVEIISEDMDQEEKAVLDSRPLLDEDWLGDGESG